MITVYEKAMGQVWLRLEAIAQQHHVADALQMLVRVSITSPLARSPVPPCALQKPRTWFIMHRGFTMSRQLVTLQAAKHNITSLCESYNAYHTYVYAF